MGYTRPREGGAERLRAVRRVLWWVLFLNLAVAGAKLGYGLFIHSVSVTADGFHSMFDGTSNVLGLIGLGFAARPADKDHPYGHAKYETFASAAIGALLLFAAYEVGSGAIARLRAPGAGPSVDAVSFVVMLFTFAVNIIVTTAERRAGKRLTSDILIADASHTGSDLLVTLGVIVGLAAVRLGYPIADPIIALVVTGFIIATAFRVLSRASVTLADTARIEPARVSDVALGIEGVKGCHDVRSRGTESEAYVDLHIQVAPDTSLEQAHAIAERVEKAVAEEFAQVVDVIVHVEPYDRYQQEKTAKQAENGML